MALVMQLVFNAFIAGAVNALLGVGLQLAYATTRVLHLAHGAVVLGAGYMAFDLSRHGLPSWGAACVAVVVATTAGVAMETFVYAPMRRRGATGLTLLLASFALLTIGTNVLLIRYGAGTVRPLLPLVNDPWILAGAAVTPLQALLFALIAVLLLGLGVLFRWTRIGIAVRAVADHPTVAAVVGIPVARTQLAAFTLASFTGAAAGVLLALELNLTPELATLYAVKGFAAAIIGGAGSIPGAIVAGLFLGVVQQVGPFLIGGGWQEALTFGLVFLFLVARPQGLFGRR